MSNAARRDTTPAPDGIDYSQHIIGYARLGIEQGDGSYNAGFSIYSAAWPLMKHYPGSQFQSGLFGTWMYPDAENPNIEDLWFYNTIEGGLGWWRGRHFQTTTPKFVMGAVALGFCAWANGPGMGKGRDWDNPKGQYGVAQLSPNLLFPPDGVNIKQGACGELLGYGYLPLPLANAKSTTSGAPVPTGDQCWTLFLNAANFKGPATFILPYFFSAPSVEHPGTAGLFLDNRPAKQNRTHSMETQFIPLAQATTDDGRKFARMAPTLFPARDDGPAVVLHQVTAYKKAAKWDQVKAWFDGGDVPPTEIAPEASFKHSFDSSRGVEWGLSDPNVPRDKRVPLVAPEFILPDLPDPYSLGYSAQSDLVKRVEIAGGQYLMLPEFFQFAEGGPHGTGEWHAVAPEDVPAETGLHELTFETPEEPAPEPLVTPDDPESCWKTPGPAAGPFTAHPGDGSTVTYYWYRFADQPSMLNADLTDAEREEMQAKVEKIHRHWTKDQEYLAPPATGTLVEIDPALIVTPPEGLEVGYVPIATRQEL